MFMVITFFGLGKFSSIIVLKMFSGPLSWESSLSSIPIILGLAFSLCPGFHFAFSMTVESMVSMASSAP